MFLSIKFTSDIKTNWIMLTRGIGKITISNISDLNQNSSGLTLSISNIRNLGYNILKNLNNNL